MKKRLTPEAIDALIASVEYQQSDAATLTVCNLVLTNGCTVVGTSNVIDPANYDAELGKEAAFSNAKGKIWELEGYAMKRDMIRLPEIAARAAHEVNRLYCEEMGDASQPIWDSAPDWQKDSAFVGAMAIRDNPDLDPQDSHMGWMSQKDKDGWVYGEVKDPEKKTHPCMVPYADLPAEQQHKDLLFTTVVKAVLAD